MNREWKPGDVASFEYFGGERIAAIRTAEGKWTAYATGANGEARSWIDRPWDGLHGQRPLVVIDPEDHEQVRALSAALVAAVCVQGNEWDATVEYEIRSHMATALRSLIVDPKPDEPQGWGAVVEDRNGWYWTLVAPDSGAWANYGERGYRKWADITAVRVLSEGVDRG